MIGWIKLHRKLTEWEWYQDSHMVHLFIHLLLKANFEDKKWQGVTIQRGQIVTGRNKLSEETGISPQTIRTCIERLKSTNELTIKSTSKFSIITLCNYENYQETENEINQVINHQTNQQPTSDQPATNHYLRNKEVKEVKKENDVRPKQNFIRPTLEEVKAFCQSRNNSVDPEYFFDHYEANGWVQGRSGKHLKDWQAAVRTWERNNLNTKNGNNKENRQQKPTTTYQYNPRENDGAVRL